MLPIIIIGVAGLAAFAIYYGKMGSGISDATSQLASELGIPDMTPAPETDPNNDPVSIALPLIQKWESFSPGAYEDPPGSGKYSIGWGHQIRPGDPYSSTSVIGQSEADDLLRVDVGSAWTCVYQSVKTACSPNQYAALISLCYNIGCGNFKSSTLVKNLNAGDVDGAAEQFLVWNKMHLNGQLVESSDLTARRDDEQGLFQSGVVSA